MTVSVEPYLEAEVLSTNLASYLVGKGGKNDGAGFTFHDEAASRYASTLRLTCQSEKVKM